MSTLLNILKWPLRIIILLGYIFVPICHGGVIVFDRVTSLKTPVYLKVLTKGRFFSQGGKLVEIYVNDKKLKRILTGGDGYGYLKYTPQHLGMIRIEAMSNGDREIGILLVVDKNDKVILIEVESGFKESLFSDTVKADSRKAVETLSKTYKIIYLNRYFGTGVSKKWLENEKFPESATLKWQGSQMLKALKNKDIQLHAIIGSADLISAATKYIENRYSFEDTKNGQKVKDWQEVLKLLQEGPEKAESKPADN
jgi:hypothetical protein